MSQACPCTSLSLGLKTVAWQCGDLRIIHVVCSDLSDWSVCGSERRKEANKEKWGILEGILGVGVSMSLFYNWRAHYFPFM